MLLTLLHHMFSPYPILENHVTGWKSVKWPQKIFFPLKITAIIIMLLSSAPNTDLWHAVYMVRLFLCPLLGACLYSSSKCLIIGLKKKGKKGWTLTIKRGLEMQSDSTMFVKNNHSVRMCCALSMNVFLSQVFPFGNHWHSDDLFVN